MNISKYYNLEAEIEILGAVLKENDSIIKVIDFVQTEDFYNDRHKFIYNAMVQLYEKGSPIEIISLCDHLGGRLSDAGGISYISEIHCASSSSRNISFYASIVKEKSRCRKVKELLNGGLKHIEEDSANSEQVLEELQHNFLLINNFGNAQDGQVGTTLEMVISDLEKRCKNGGDIEGIKSNYKTLDKILGGFKKQDLIVLAARPAMGKTAVALNLALNVSMAGHGKVTFFNLEMGKKQLMERALAITTDISMEKIKNGQLTDEDWGRIIDNGDKLEGSSMKIFDNVFTFSGIRANCKKLKLQEGLDIVFIDYLQLINMEERSENRNQEISKISRRLKLMAKELDITVIALAQLSRAPELRAEHRPMLSDLRESGSIEQDADIVMFLYRDEYYDKNTEHKNLLECIIAKHRNGAVGTVRLKWRGECQKII